LAIFITCPSLPVPEFVCHLWKAGVSTADVADRDAGHGIGMDTVLEKVKKIGGYLLVESRPNIFTEYVIQFCVANRGRNGAVDR
jgi:sensor histidine kinase regulating citrate/malate metabolism